MLYYGTGFVFLCYKIKQNVFLLILQQVLKYKTNVQQNNNIMPQLINYGKEMLKISPKGIEYSTNSGRSWITRYTGSSCGTFIDLLPYGSELLAITSKGIYYSTNEGRSWISRYTGSSCGVFQNLADGGKELLANTNKGLYYSTNSGRSWIKRR